MSVNKVKNAINAYEIAFEEQWQIGCGAGVKGWRKFWCASDILTLADKASMRHASALSLKYKYILKMRIAITKAYKVMLIYNKILTK